MLGLSKILKNKIDGIYNNIDINPEEMPRYYSEIFPVKGRYQTYPITFSVKLEEREIQAKRVFIRKSEDDSIREVIVPLEPLPLGSYKEFEEKCNTIYPEATVLPY